MLLEEQNTLSIIKPDSVAKNVIGSIINRFEVSGFSVVAAKMLKLTFSQAEEFYCDHRDKFFFDDLVHFMTSGLIFVQILKRKDAIRCNRELMGVTNPMYALSGTIRSDYGENCTKNAIHGSDSIESAIREISYFFDV